ncbi:SH3 domain-containing protein [Neptuniibacter sp. QD72_48]|uniref:SH3 domain-containing protein n=1 Tax=Neptuniibacter sp. QD72_48 TaxID=3398214 RepID=UPI0039F49965
MNLKLLIIGLPFMCSTWVTAQTAYTVRDISVYQTPSISSTVVTKLSEKSSVNILRRSGGWYEVRTGNAHSGWVKMINLRYVSEPSTQQVAGNMQYRSKTTLTTGVRGLDEGGIISSGSGVSLSKVKGYKVSADVATKFAREGGLKARSMNYVE